MSDKGGEEPADSGIDLVRTALAAALNGSEPVAALAGWFGLKVPATDVTIGAG